MLKALCFSLVIIECLYTLKCLPTGALFEGDMDLTEEQKINIQMSIDGVPTYGATTYRNWPKQIAYAIDPALGKCSLFSCT